MRADKIEKLDKILSLISWSNKVSKKDQPCWLTEDKWQWNLECEKRYSDRLRKIFNTICEQLKFEL